MLIVADTALFELMNGSYTRLLGESLVKAGQNASWLYEQAPFALLAHNTDPDPRFIYANCTAQKCFEYSWEEFLQLPSRLSAQAPAQLERQRQLEQVSRNGYIRDYRGVRISRSGRLFLIENAVIWQLLDEHGISHGQAARIDSWRDV